MTPTCTLAVTQRLSCRPPGAPAALILALCAALPLSAQAPTKPDEVQIKVTEAPTSSQVISVPVNQGVIVDFSVPLREVGAANPAIATVTLLSPKQILVNGKAFGTTQLLATVDGGEQRAFTIAVDLDLERLQASIRTTVPRARVKATAMLNSVLLTGTVPDAESAERVLQIAKIYSQQVVNHVRVAGVHQVLLRCTVAEVNRRAIRQLGFNGWIAGDGVPSMFGFSNLNNINPTNIGAAGNANVTSQIPFVTDRNGIPVTQNTTLSFGFPQVQMQVFVQALRENNLMQILAEPNLVTISGQEAKFLAGGEFPIPVPQGGANNAITIEYRQFGVMLRFTPAVLSENLIRINVNPEVSEPDYASAITLSGYVVPGLVERSVNTVVELGSGQTFAIGGLLSERTRGVSRKVPALGDVPVLGALFSSVEYQTEETELVVLVTPELVEPITPDQVGYIPGDGRSAPNDAELFLLGRLDALKTKARSKTGARTSQIWPATTEELYGPRAALQLRGPVGPSGGDEGL